MSRKVNVLFEVCRVECRKKLFGVRIRRIVKMKIEITSDKKLMRSSSSDRKQLVKIFKKLRKRYR